jgi:type IV pilus assembly protein PilB
VNQVQINPKAGLLFSSGLRSILRQDPNIILVGEIRDGETAEIAIRSALTGHLVLSTLHTNDAAGAVTRLVDMGIEPFLVASSVLGAIAQRLVRRICPDCKQSYQLDPNSVEGQFVSGERPNSATFFKGVGCPRCGNTGYRGRIAIHEVLPMSPAIREMVTNRAPSGVLAKQARSEGMLTMQQDGIAKAVAGHTTVQEVMRVAYSEV